MIEVKFFVKKLLIMFGSDREKYREGKVKNNLIIMKTEF